MLHTIQEATSLTGKSRRTIYNHCDLGLVSFTVGPDGRRYFETSELIRCYGELPGEPDAKAEEVRPRRASEIMVLMLDELKGIRESIEGIREGIQLIGKSNPIQIPKKSGD